MFRTIAILSGVYIVILVLIFEIFDKIRLRRISNNELTIGEIDKVSRV